MPAFVLRSERVATPAGVRAAAVRVRDGRIESVGPYDAPAAGVPELDVGNHVVLPGLVDSHVHINDPGRADWEGFEHATRAAAAGGVTTLVDMPLNSVPPTTTVDGLEAKRAAASGRCYVDVAFWGGVVPGNREHLLPLAQAGVAGFKCFLCPSGVDEFGHVVEQDLREALPVLAELGLPLLVHAELPQLLRDPTAPGDGQPGDPRQYATWLASRPPASERVAIDLILRLAEDFNARVHIVHLATADAIEAISDARRNGVAVTVETCPHYLRFAAEEIPAGATAFKCAPPIRERDQRERLWKGLVAGAIDLIASDHSPAPPALKRLAEGDFVRAWGGIASLQVALPAVWTGMEARGVPLDRLAGWLAAAPARLAGLEGVKGAIAPGCDADLTVFDPEDRIAVSAQALYHRHPVTPYHGARLLGSVKMTILRGEVVFENGECRGAPSGTIVSRGSKERRAR
jgi:allantoinase